MDYDIIIIGSGAGGGTLAHSLAATGKRILIIERGDYLRRERENWEAESVFVEARYQAKEVWHDQHGKPFHPGIHYYVGGNTKMYGAALLRLRERDFGEIRHHGGISPAWPLDYQDFEPYYSRAEHLYQVHGEHGIDPTEPFSSTAYPHPAVSHEPRIQTLYDGLKGLASCWMKKMACQRHKANASAAMRLTATRAWSTARPMRRSSASTLRWRSRTSP
jgi:choline dehydrogenase-like flavoprotein